MNATRYRFAVWGWLILCIAVGIGCGNGATDRGQRDATETAKATAGKCERIVSLAPSITEILIALELGPSVVGVTRYCERPHSQVAVIGGYSDPSYERILSLKPDLVAMLDLHARQKQDLDKLHLNTIELRSGNITEIQKGILTLANRCDVGERGKKLVTWMQQEIATIRKQWSGTARSRVLVSVGRSMGTGSVQDIFVAGKSTWLNDLIEIAGGVNAMEDSGVQYPKLSAEGVMQINPDVIVELIPIDDSAIVSDDQILSQWQIASEVEAVKNRRIHVLRHKNIAQPGPGVVNIARIISQLIHGEAVTSAAGLSARDTESR